jgi:hypothetical protein
MGGAGLRAPATAPGWLQEFAREVEAWSAAQQRGPQTLSAFSRTAMPLAADHPFALVAVADGAGNRHVAVSNGTAWYYLDGTAV